MAVTLEEAKERLATIIRKARVDLYKPIQIAEVLHRSRVYGDIIIAELATYQNPSLRWRNEVTRHLSKKASTSSARYQHDVWNLTAMPPEILAVLDTENKRTNGAVEQYIYFQYRERQNTVATIIALIEAATPETFQVERLLQSFIRHAGIRRSIDKAYEIVTYSVLETVVVALGATVRVQIPPEKLDLLNEFGELGRTVLGLDRTALAWEQPAHIYRVGVTNAADRGLDMWANFGPAIQVKHLVLDESLANDIVDQVESDHVVIVCRDVDAGAIQAIAKQIGWGRRVRGIIRESDLIAWYERCLRGKYSDNLAVLLLETLREGFKAEFPQASALNDLLEARGYLALQGDAFWQ
jgi:hypothetical protein